MRRYKLFPAWIAFAILSVGWMYFAGKDLNWDFINYHFYAPYEFLNQRLEIDYFAASIQGYLNPIGFVPLYALIKIGVNPIVIGGILALIHSLNFAFLWLISRQLIPEKYPHRSLALWGAVLLSFLAPLQLTMLGGTPLDPITSVLVLMALYILIRHVDEINPSRAFLIGCVAGMAAGLKLTNLLVLPAFAIGIAVGVGAIGIRGMAIAILAYCVGVALGFMVAHGYWSFELWRKMGNPIFPLMNGVFNSPDFSTANFQDRRYIDSQWWSILTLPVKMLSHRSAAYAENIAADPRPLGLCVALIILWLQRVLSREGATQYSIENRGNSAFRLTLVFAGVFYVAWGEASRIGRYALPLWLLVGPLIVATVIRIKWRRISLVVLCATAFLQVLFLHTNGNPRWTAAEWGDRWLEVNVPNDLKENPYAYVTMGTLSYSAIIPSFNEKSRFANIVGQYMQPAGANMTKRMRDFLASDLPLKAIFSSALQEDGYPSTSRRMDVNATLAPYGLRLAAGKCELAAIEFQRIGSSSEPESRARNHVKHEFAICPIEQNVEKETRQALVEMAAIDMVFDRLERLCPALFAPHGLQTMAGGRGWMRRYSNTNNQLMTDGAIVAVRVAESYSDVILGSVEDIQMHEFKCPSLVSQF